MPASRVVIGAAVVAGATLLWWLAAGPRLIALVDSLTTAPNSEPSTPADFMFDEGNKATFETPRLAFGDRQRAVPASWRMVETAPGRLAIETPNATIPLGIITRRWTNTPSGHGFAFAPEPGDVVSFTRRHSRVPWPRPFAINWLGGSHVWWGRYVYHRLVWTKPDGAVLDMVWRDEQRLMTGQGWQDQYEPWPPVATSVKPARDGAKR